MASALPLRLSGLKITDNEIEENLMLKTYLSLFLSGLLLIGVCAAPALASSPATQLTTEQVKIQVAKLGLGAKAKATITLNNGTKIKGYIVRADDDGFVLRDRKTDAPTTIRYADVTKVQANKGHSMARNVAIGVGIGVGAVVLALALIFSQLND
jgi:hypothetical protein